MKDSSVFTILEIEFWKNPSQDIYIEPKILSINYVGFSKIDEEMLIQNYKDTIYMFIHLCNKIKTGNKYNIYRVSHK